MFQHRRVRVAALAIATAVAVPAVSLIATTSAQAGGGYEEHPYKGKVIAKTLTIRSHPTTYGKRLGTYKKGETVKISCKVEAVPVDGNRIWYSTPKGDVAARYVTNIGKAPQWCGGRWWDWAKAVGKPSVNLRKAPTSKSKLVGKVKYGKRVSIICKVNGPKVGGNPRWYQLEDGRWVAARYVQTVGDWIPQYCNK
ncbi:SH3 domain-containing protein [Tenggerimyces flavus]|uniref:SH3 domain-containing protein n=1 Tax=Tenggerimyces flavus TaxID=1708749 RepID=A0ABV7Y7M7_9ACTN|nr:SH3 domain-containing protein [Tenggerimyces flavus]MBM7785228.1 uncharacterized protein YgiM (DUF1202 family) [Tenggerimyces flavus]